MCCGDKREERNNSNTCCAARQIQQHHQASSIGDSDAQVTDAPCCKLVFTSQPPGASNASVEVPTAYGELTTIAPAMFDAYPARTERWQKLRRGSVPPPEDLVIRLLRLAI